MPEREICHDYDDIIDLPHPTSERHPRMPMDSRAAQFSPFAALTGYEDVIDETARLTDKHIPLEDEQRLEIDERLDMLKDLISERPQISVRYFVPDERKEGGRYVTFTGNVRKIDDLDRLITFTDGTKIHVDDIYSVTGEIFRSVFDD